MASLFDSSNINQLTLNNRFIRSATASGMADKRLRYAKSDETYNGTG
jgi:2,4-dienoyl-CoA reductase-like NADH-dependent reductase (Old Yellow Enzyme family)